MDSVPVQFVTTSDEYNIAYAVAGQGLPLVRVPSMFSHFSLQWSRGVLEREFRAYSDHFQLVLVDHRGQGSSTRGLPETTSLDDYVGDLELLVDRLDLERFVLLGWSATAKIAVSYALRSRQGHSATAKPVRRSIPRHTNQPDGDGAVRLASLSPDLWACGVGVVRPRNRRPYSA